MFFEVGPEVGRVVITTSGVVGDSGKPQALYGYAFKSSGTAGVLSLFNGTSSLGSIVWDDTGIISTTKVVPLGAGIVFSSGLAASFDGNVTKATFFVRQV